MAIHKKRNVTFFCVSENGDNFFQTFRNFSLEKHHNHKWDKSANQKIKKDDKNNYFHLLCYLSDLQHIIATEQHTSEANIFSENFRILTIAYCKAALLYNEIKLAQLRSAPFFLRNKIHEKNMEQINNLFNHFMSLLLIEPPKEGHIKTFEDLHQCISNCQAQIQHNLHEAILYLNQLKRMVFTACQENKLVFKK